MKTRIYFVLTACLSILVTSCTKESHSLSASAASQSSVESQCYIGKYFQGGIIFYIDSTGRHGLIAATKDFEEAFVYAYSDTVTGARGTAIGFGRKNTTRIVKVQGDPGDQAEDYAALECYEFTDNGFSDWYLPSKDELNELYKQKDVVGGFSPFAYWSSSEINISTAWFQNFSNGSQVKSGKIAAYAVRPIRHF